jgi:hypothetical protein
MRKGAHHSAESIAKIKAAKKGSRSWNTGRTLSKEVREKISATKLAAVTPETRRQSSLAGQEGTGTKHTDASSRFHGVSWEPRRGMWYVKLYLHKGRGGVKFIGYYSAAEAGARAWDNQVKELQLERPLNFPDPLQPLPEPTLNGRITRR